MMDATKYAPGYYPVPAGYDSWVKKDHIEKAPAWCSVDLRDGNTGAAYQQIEEAKAVCRTCKVIDACLKCALDTNQDYGVWGGLSEDERRALKRRAMRARRSQAMQMQI